MNSQNYDHKWSGTDQMRKSFEVSFGKSCLGKEEIIGKVQIKQFTGKTSQTWKASHRTYYSVIGTVNIHKDIKTDIFHWI